MKQIKLGCHMSIAGGVEKSFQRSAEIGATSLQVFSKSPRGRSLPTRTEEQFELARQQRKLHHQTGGLIHSNYLANLSKPSDECAKDIASIIDDFHVAHETGFDAINVHIGKGKGFSTRDEAMKNMAKNVEYIISTVQKKGWNVQYVFENTAGQGSELGNTIEEIGYFYKNFLKDLPVKFCIDTCHARAGGIDYTDFDAFLSEFDDKVGLDQLYSFHMNDSKAPLGSKLDRHANLGRGFVGFSRLVAPIQRAAKTGRGIYIETPNMDLRLDEIAKVKSIIDGKIDRIEKFDKENMGTDILKKFEGYVQGLL